MSERSAELAVGAFGLFNRRDWDAFVALMEPDVVVESRLVAIEGGYRGHEGVRRWWDNFLGAFPDYSIEIDEVRDLGDVLLCHIRGWGHSSASGTPLADPIWVPMAWRGERCRWWRVCTTEAEALDAIARWRASESEPAG